MCFAYTRLWVQVPLSPMLFISITQSIFERFNLVIKSFVVLLPVFIMIYIMSYLFYKKKDISIAFLDYWKKKRFICLFLWILIILPVSAFWVNSLVCICISSPLVVLSWFILFSCKNANFIILGLAIYYLMLWFIGLFLFVASRCELRFFTTKINNFFGKKGLVGFIGNSAGGNVSKWVMGAGLPSWFAWGTAADWELTSQATKIVLQEPNMSVNHPEFTHKVQSCKGMLGRQQGNIFQVLRYPFSYRK